MKVRNKYLLIVTMAWVPCCALAAASYLFVLGPQARCATALQAKLAETRSLWDIARQAVVREEQVRLAQTVERLSRRVSGFVVRLEAAPDLAFEIAQLANETAVESFAMKPRNKRGLDAVPNCDRIGEKQIDVSFTARFPGFVAFLNALERHHPVLFVETFAISQRQGESSEPQVTIQLAVLVEKPQGAQTALANRVAVGLGGPSGPLL